MNIALICYKMGWDYHTYMNQPTWFIRLIADIIRKQYEDDSAKITNFDRRPR